MWTREELCTQSREDEHHKTLEVQDIIGVEKVRVGPGGGGDLNHYTDKLGPRKTWKKIGTKRKIELNEGEDRGTKGVKGKMSKRRD